MLPLEVPAFGGELPLGCDPLLADPIALSASCLAFSHGRAALRWLCQWRGHFDCAVLSAYTCPTVIDLLDSLGIRMRFVDILHGDWEAVVRTENGRLLVLVPAFLGHDPDADLPALATAVGEHGLVLVDAAQTAFGHLLIEELDNVAVLSDPRKCTALGDGAILRMRGVSEAERAFVKTLPWAMGPVAAKISARWLMACRSPANEPDALALVAQAERGWPDTPHRMSDAGLWWLSWLDPHAHARARQRNWAALAQALGDAVRGRAPFWRRAVQSFDSGGRPGKSLGAPARRTCLCDAALAQCAARERPLSPGRGFYASPGWLAHRPALHGIGYA